MVAAIPPVGGGVPAVPTTAASKPAAPGFGDAISSGLEEVSRLEHQADALTEQMAAGESVSIHELMVATSKASVGVELASQVRNRAVEAYQEIMRLPV